MVGENLAGDFADFDNPFVVDEPTPLEAAYASIVKLYTDAGMVPPGPPDAGMNVERFLRQAENNFNNLRRRGHGDPEFDEIARAKMFADLVKAVGPVEAERIKAAGGVNAAMWEALGENPALFQQLQAANMGGFMDFFWNKFPEEMKNIGEIIGTQLNLNADRISAMTIERGRDAGQTERLGMTLAALRDIMGGFSGALGSGLGALGGWAASVNPLGQALGLAGQEGGGGFKVNFDENGNLITTNQDFTGGVPSATSGQFRGIPMSLAGNAAAQEEAGQAASAGQRAALGRFSGTFDTAARRQGDTARQKLMGAIGKAHSGQVGNAVDMIRNRNKNILASSRARGTVAGAQGAARARLLGKLGNVFGSILG